MSDILCITNSRLCKGNFFKRIDRIAACKPAGIVLREKDLTETEYLFLASQVQKICQAYDTSCILHNFVDAAIQLEAKAIHLPLPVLRGLTESQKAAFDCIGASCHSVKDALEAQRLGCTYITAGHIFETDCKKGLPGRGPAFLQKVVDAVNMPVYAIGGISPENIGFVRSTGAKGGCVMSSAMQCEDVTQYVKKLEA